MQTGRCCNHTSICYPGTSLSYSYFCSPTFAFALLLLLLLSYFCFCSAPTFASATAICSSLLYIDQLCTPSMQSTLHTLFVQSTLYTLFVQSTLYTLFVQSTLHTPFVESRSGLRPDFVTVVSDKFNAQGAVPVLQ